VSTGSLRRRVALVALPLLVVALVGSAAVVTLSYRDGLENDLRNRMLAGAKAVNGTPPDQLKPILTALVLQGIDTRVGVDPRLAATGTQPLAPVPQVRSTGQLLVVRMPIQKGPLGAVATLSASRAGVDRAVQQLVVIEIAVALATIAIAALLLVRGLRSALQPLAHVGAVAARIADGAHDERLRPDRPHTELGRMAAAFDHMVDELEESIARARASESAMRRFLADASHELRTPIAALQATVETLLREQPARPERDELEARAARDATRLGRLVADLLDLARLEAKEALAKQPVDVGEAAIRAVAEATGHLPGTVVDLDADAGAVVLGDADAVSRALRNLVDNAVAAAGESGRVWVVVERDGADVIASVEDDGPGVPTAERERIFEGFVRLEPVRGPGAGLGLAIARRVAREHEGDLTYAGGSRGARFVLRLPAAAESGLSTGALTIAR
jgi:two-component system, OmpR family, sensor kinase